MQGSYNYVDPTGALVTVTYQAGPEGYTENREVQEGAVQIEARNIPQPWTGPLAGVSSSSSASSGSTSSGSTSSGSSLSQSDLIAQILKAIQPQISSAVQSAIGSRSTTSLGSSRLSSGNLQTSSRRGFTAVASATASRTASTPSTRRDNCQSQPCASKPSHGSS